MVCETGCSTGAGRGRYTGSCQGHCLRRVSGFFVVMCNNGVLQCFTAKDEAEGVQLAREAAKNGHVPVLVGQRLHLVSLEGQERNSPVCK